MATVSHQTESINGKQYRSVREGRASILAPYHEDKTTSIRKGHNNDEGSQAVFYNPIQQFNRDLSVLAILIYGEGAISEKTARWAKRSAKQRRPPQKPDAESSKAVRDSEPDATSRKRKADSLDQDDEGDHVKRKRTDEFDEDEEEIEILQLNGNGQASEIGAKESQGLEHALPENEGTNSEQAPRKTRFAILDALSATGLRALRYAKEITFATHVVANDVSREAVKSIELNIDHNDVSNIVHSNVDDARAYMYGKVGNERSTSDTYIHRFDVVDLDPYGTAAPFLDAAVQCLQDGGLLCVTCTDAGVFASNGYPEKAYSLYGGIPCKGPWSHEAGLRLIINSIATIAAKYGIAIEPLLSLSIDFYARVFIRVHKSPQDVKMLAGTTMTVYNCDFGCGAWTTQTLARNQERTDKKGGTYYKHTFTQAPSVAPTCEHCGTRMHLGGPMWAGPLHNPYFVQRMLDRLPTLDTNVYGTIDRLRGMLTLALEEDLTLASTNTQANTPAIKVDASETSGNIIPRVPPTTIDNTPFFFIPGFLAKVLHCATPAEDQLRGALRSLGYLVTRSHCKPGSFKTNAPWTAIWEIMREWVRQKAPIKEGAVSDASPGGKILQKMLGTRGKLVHDVTSELKSGLQGANGEDNLKVLLRSAMYRLEHEQPVGSDDQANSTNSQIRFDERLGREKPRGKLVRYQINPRANWGPMNRAGGGV